MSIAQQHQLGRNGGGVLAGIQPEQAEIDLDVAVGRGRPPSARMRSRARARLGSSTGRPASFSAVYALMVALISEGPWA